MIKKFEEGAQERRAAMRTIIGKISHKLLLQLDIKWLGESKYTTYTAQNYNNQGGKDYYVVAPSKMTRFDLKITTPNNLTYLIITEPNTHPNPLWGTHLFRTTPANICLLYTSPSPRDS